VSGLGRGINFGGAFEADGPPWPRDRHFALVRDSGFATVRLPVKWSAHAEAQPPYAIDPAFLAAVERAAATALEHGLDVVVNVHHYDELSAAPDVHAPRFLALWRRLAAHLPAGVHVELLNEPHGALRGARWNALLAEALAIVRDADAERPVIAGPAHRNVVAGLEELELPDDEHLVVTIHYYLPFEFTHQGAPWIEGADAWRGTRWDGGDTGLAPAAAWGAAHGYPVFVGEFGVYSAVPMPERAAWVGHVRREAERLGMSWAYWDFATDFGAYDPVRGAWHAALYEALTRA